MSHIPRLTMIGLYNEDRTLFDGLSLPEGTNKNIFINSFLLEYGECRALYPDPDFTKLAIANFSLKWSDGIARIYTALSEEYNPIHNYDRYEKNTLDMTGTIALEMKGTISNELTDRTTENLVSAYNESDYQPDSKTVQNGTSEDDYNRTDTTRRNAKDTEDKHQYGNIGITRSQEMVRDELTLRAEQNFYHIVSEMLYKEICLYYF